MKTISIINKKGGVSKTTSTINLAEYFIRRHGYRVLLVDLDDQPSLTNTFNIPNTKVTINDIFEKKATAVAYEIKKGKLSIIPSCVDFANVDSRIINRLERERIIRNAIKPFDAEFDLCIIDCPPTLNIVTINALVASDYVLIPLIPSRRASEGLNVTIEVVNEIKDVINPTLEILGIVLTRFDPRRKTSQSTLETLCKNQLTAPYISQSKIRICEAVPKSEELNESVFETHHSSTAATDYENLGDEIFEKISKH